jgi:PKD domain
VPKRGTSRAASGALRRARTGCPRRFVGVLAAILALSLCAAAPAGAVLTPEGFGIQRRREPLVNGKSPLQYHGGPVLHKSNAYAIYWDPEGLYWPEWERSIDEYFQNVSSASGSLENVFALDAQYTDTTGRAANQSTFLGAYNDFDPYPTSNKCAEPAEVACITDAQIRAELAHLININALPGTAGQPVYYVLTPPGVTVCTKESGGECSEPKPPRLRNEQEEEEEVGARETEEREKAHEGFCGYHSYITQPGSSAPIVYAVQPWVAGDAGEKIEAYSPELITSGVAPDVPPCQAERSPISEPNQLGGTSPFSDNYAAGLPDIIINDLSIEQRNVAVDPLLNAWYQETTDAEQGDMCQWYFGAPPEKEPSAPKTTHAINESNETINGTNYFLSWGFNSTGMTSRHRFECWQGVTLNPHFTAPRPVNAGEVVAFKGTESYVTLDAASNLPADEPFTPAIYKWNFGDGTTVSGADNTESSVFHTYKYGGTCEVTLTVTDSGENVRTFSETIIVSGPPPPSNNAQGACSPPASEGSGGGGSGGSEGSGGSGGSSGSNTTSGSGGSSGSSSSSGSGGTPAPPPVASTAVVSHSLSSALKGGLVVSYAVNQQVAGNFQVLLAASIGKRVGLTHPLATGLPQGTPPQVVVAKALVVTAKGGHSTLKVVFSKTAAQRLRRLHTASLIVRLVVRNSSGGLTTVLKKITLSH